MDADHERVQARSEMIWRRPDDGWTGPTPSQIRAALAVAGLSQTAAAHRLGITPRTMRYWCAGDKIPDWPAWTVMLAWAGHCWPLGCQEPDAAPEQSWMPRTAHNLQQQRDRLAREIQRQAGRIAGPADSPRQRVAITRAARLLTDHARRLASLPWPADSRPRAAGGMWPLILTWGIHGDCGCVLVLFKKRSYLKINHLY